MATNPMIQNLTNCTQVGALPSYDEVQIKNVNIILTANDGYLFDPYTPVISVSDGFGGTDNAMVAVVSADKKTASLVGDGSTSWLYPYSGNLTLQGIASEVLTAPMDYTNVTNCTHDGKSNYMESELSSVVITYVANDGYEFLAGQQTNEPYFEMPDGFGGDVPVFGVVVISADKKSVTISIDFISQGYDIYTPNNQIKAYAVAYVATPIGDNFGAINVYEVDLQDITDFSAIRYNDNTLDLGTLVHSIRKVFVPVLETLPDTIKCGDINTLIEVNAPTTNIVSVDFGSVLIPEHNNDNIDYNTTIQIFLPFYGFKDISSDYIGKQVYLKYEVDLITGEGVVFLSADNIVFDVVDCTPSQNYIFTNQDNNNINIIGVSDFNTQSRYGFVPYVFIKWYASKNNSLHQPTNERVLIGNQTGYIEVNECDNFYFDGMLDREKESLIEALQNGVFVN